MIENAATQKEAGPDQAGQDVGRIIKYLGVLEEAKNSLVKYEETWQGKLTKELRDFKKKYYCHRKGNR